MPDILNIMLRAAGSCGDSPRFLSAGHQPSGVPTSVFTQLSVGCSLWVISAFDPWLFRSVPDAQHSVQPAAQAVVCSVVYFEIGGYESCVYCLGTHTGNHASRGWVRRPGVYK